MRITNQMLNESARKAGLPVNNTSLLNYINNDSSENTLLSALDKNGSGAVDTVKKSSYEKTEKEADQLLQKTEIFLDEGKTSIFAKARESGSSQEIYDAAKALVGQYNSVASALRKEPSALNNFYRQMMSEAASENSEGLKNIGITLTKDGTLSIDEEKLKASDLDTLEQVLGPANGFSGKVAFLANRISDNARANVQSLSSQYNSTGTFYSALASKYNFLG